MTPVSRISLAAVATSAVIAGMLAAPPAAHAVCVECDEDGCPTVEEPCDKACDLAAELVISDIDCESISTIGPGDLPETGVRR